MRYLFVSRDNRVSSRLLQKADSIPFISVLIFFPIANSLLFRYSIERSSIAFVAADCASSNFPQHLRRLFLSEDRNEVVPLRFVSLFHRFFDPSDVN